MRAFNLILAIAISTSPAHTAQTAPDSTIIRTTTRLVTVNVLVRDKNGAESNLGKDDFALFDNGKHQKISFFTVDTNQATLAGQTPRHEQNLFTNVIEKHANTPTNITVILLDALNTCIVDQQYVLKQVKAFLVRLRPTDCVAIYTLGRTLNLLHDFTADPQQLEQALAGYSGRNDSIAESTVPQQAPRTENATHNAILKQMLDSAAKSLLPLYFADAARRTAAALEGIANQVGPLPGRKNLVWISSSFPLTIGVNENEAPRSHDGRAPADYKPREPSGDRRIFSREVDRAARALNNASLAIYPVDARGLTGLTNEYKAESGMTGIQATVDLKPLTGRPAGQDTMRELAARTGGKAFLDNNDIASAVREAIDDSAITYTLGFYPESGSVDARYHELRVEVPGHPGLSVRCRKGYYADDSNAIPIETIKEEVDNALWSPLEAKGIAVVARLNREAASLKLSAIIAAEHLSIEAAGDRWKGVIDVITAQGDGNGKILKSQNKSAAVDLNRESYDYYLKNGVAYSSLVPIVPGAQELRLVVVDRKTGALGSVIIPVGDIH